MSTHTQLINLCPLKMAFFDGGIIAVCWVAGWTGSVGPLSLLVFLTRKRLTNSDAAGQRDSCTLCFQSIPTPVQKALGREIKGQDAGTLGRFSLRCLSLRFSRPEKKTFEMVLDRLGWKEGPCKDTACCSQSTARSYTTLVHSE